MSRPPRPVPSRPAEPEGDDGPQRLDPPPGVPARIWLDLLEEHPELGPRLAGVDEAGSEALVDEVTALVNARLAEEAGDPADDSEDAEAVRFELLLERYAALVTAIAGPERIAFEREWPELVEFVRDDPEGRALLAELRTEEQALRRELPRY